MPHHRQARTSAAIVVGRILMVVMVVLVAACSSSTPDETVAGDQTSVVVSGSDRAVLIETSGCGVASKTRGSGVLVGNGEVLTVAHVVASAQSQQVRVDGVDYEADVIALDLERDLALLRVPAAASPIGIPPSLTVGSVGDAGTIYGGASSGDVPFEISQVATIVIDEVRGTGRASRLGYRVETSTVSGDSGAGLYDSAGRLLGLLFATATEHDGESWATAAAEIEAFLDDPALSGPFFCDVESSKLQQE